MSSGAHWKRRDFLRLTGAGLGAAAFSCLPKKSADTAWGAWPTQYASLALSESQQAQSVLELYLYGGISPWETFYVVPEPDYGQADQAMWWTFQEGVDGVPARYATCQGSGAPPLLQPFEKDANGVMVNLGPFLEPLRSRSDITSRLRLHVMSHTSMPHEVAVPLALTGYYLGAPQLAAVGAAVQHYYLARNPAPTQPFTYLISPLHQLFTTLFGSAYAVGQHPASSRPLLLHVNADNDFVQSLQRPAAGGRLVLADAILQKQTELWANQLVRNGNTLRAGGRDDYAAAISQLSKAPSLSSMISQQYFNPIPGESCGESSPESLTAMQLRLAGHILSQPGGQAKHVTITDIALFQNISVGYDTHKQHIYDMSRNLPYVMGQLSAIINAPGENSPGKISLDKTLVVLNWEFGRGPLAQNSDGGRNHYPFAYVTAMFGGPVGTAQRGIVGSILPTASASNALAPLETRAAQLCALGIWPFTSEGYSPTDVNGAQNAEDAARKLKEVVLGVV